MISFSISSVRLFMKQLFLEDTYRPFELVKAEISTFVDYEVFGLLNPEWFPDKQPVQSDPAALSYVPWSQIQEQIFHMIQGDKTPLKMKFVLIASAPLKESVLRSSPDSASIAPGDVTGMFFNIDFKNGALTLTTGTAMKTFTLDKSAEKAFDTWARHFLDKCALQIAELS